MSDQRRPVPYASRPNPQPDSRDDGVFVRRHPPRKGPPTWAYGIIAVLALSCTVMAFIAVKGPSLRKAGGSGTTGGGSSFSFSVVTPGDEGETWTYRELVDYLRSRGVSAHMATGSSRGVWVGANATELQEAVSMDDGRDVSPFWFSYPLAYILRVPTSEDARQQAGRTDSGRTFHWGRFIVTGKDAAYVAQIRKALGG